MVNEKVIIKPKGLNVALNEHKFDAYFRADKKEYEVIVPLFPFKRVFGKSIDNAKSNFKLQVETAKDFEVIWY